MESVNVTERSLNGRSIRIHVQETADTRRRRVATVRQSWVVDVETLSRSDARPQSVSFPLIFCLSVFHFPLISLTFTSLQLFLFLFYIRTFYIVSLALSTFFPVLVIRTAPLSGLPQQSGLNSTSGIQAGWNESSWSLSSDPKVVT
jgi:hypothetical protein